LAVRAAAIDIAFADGKASALAAELFASLLVLNSLSAFASVLMFGSEALGRSRLRG
jgi:hypothetical protein